jgi:DNA polymerase-3 subunit gamma/tau
MAYLVLARKYRPQTFDDVIGQAHVTQTLQNAITGGRVAHAMLFSGPRGTGKTTIARILAKAMNCEDGATPHPCNTCRSCTDITAGRGVDVFEIDGASNNSVDQVRELRENSRYMPAHSRYKIYIIDEVHMLSLAAFNALLKTLEEPPSHVLFFFATTEAHKIPITILSRCQRHDLKRIDHSAVVGHLENLCQQEKVSVSADNLRTIARESGGSMRDALSLLDQILACSDSPSDDDTVMHLLGGMDRQVLLDLSEAVFAKEISRVLSIIDGVYTNGNDLKRFYTDLLAHFRHLMLIKMDVRSELLTELAPGEIKTLNRQVQDLSVAFLDQVFTVLFNAETRVRHASQPRLAIEMAFFKVHQITPALPIDVLIERLDSLLKAPHLVHGQGIVEDQTAYGRPATTPDGSTRPSDVPRSVEISDAAMPPPPNPEQPTPADDRAASPDDAWTIALGAIAARKPAIGAALARSRMIAVSEQDFSVAVCDNEYTINLIKKNQDLIADLCREHAGRGIQIEFRRDTDGARHSISAKQKADEMRQQLLNHPLVADAVDIFSGKIEEIKIK